MNEIFSEHTFLGQWPGLQGRLMAFWGRWPRTPKPGGECETETHCDGACAMLGRFSHPIPADCCDHCCMHQHGGWPNVIIVRKLGGHSPDH